MRADFVNLCATFFSSFHSSPVTDIPAFAIDRFANVNLFVRDLYPFIREKNAHTTGIWRCAALVNFPALLLARNGVTLRRAATPG